MKHLKKLFIVALCAQAYTANAGLDWAELAQGVNTLTGNLNIAVARIKEVIQERSIAEGELLQAREYLANAGQISQEDANSFKILLDTVNDVNNEFAKLMSPGGNNPGSNVPQQNQNMGDNVQQQNQNFQNQGVQNQNFQNKNEMDVEYNQGQGVRNQDMGNNVLQGDNNQNFVQVGDEKKKVGSKQDKINLDTIYATISNSTGRVSNVNQTALINAFNKFYQEEPKLEWDSKIATLNKVYETAKRYGFVPK